MHYLIIVFDSKVNTSEGVLASFIIFESSFTISGCSAAMLVFSPKSLDKSYNSVVVLVASKTWYRTSFQLPFLTAWRPPSS